MTDLVVSQSARSARVPRAARAGWAHTGGLLLRGLRGVATYLDESEASRTTGARGIRYALALLFAIYGAVLEVTSLSHGNMSALPLLLFMGAIALALGRGGRFLYYFVPVFLGLVSYVLAGRFVERFKLPTYYTPQLKLEEWLPGPLPTLWLQNHLYNGRAGPLEIFAVTMYLSHFGVALAVAFGLVIVGRSRAFADLMFSILAVSILAEVTFVLAPTAPPWLAAEKGYLPPVDHMLKDSLYDLHLTKLADFVGNPHNYDVTAAVPSLHVAFPLLCLFTALRYGLPRWLSALLTLNTLGVTFAIVYLGDHYFVDALAGAAYALAAWRLVRLLTGGSPQATPTVRSATGVPARGL